MNINYCPMGDYQTNCYIVTLDNKDIIIDPGIDSSKWIKNNANNPIAILNTHGHFDHIWSNQKIKEFFNIKLYTPINDNFMLTLDQFGHEMPHSKADVLVNPDEEIVINDIKIKFHHFPGHTPGCSAIEIENNLFTGDFIFKGTIGRFDFPFSDEKKMKESINKILKWQLDYNIYPGHGNKTTLKKEIETLKMWEKRFL